MAIQRFVKCKGGNAFICRTNWRAKKAAICYIITNKTPFNDKDVPEHERFITCQSKRISCSIVESKGNTNYGETVE